MIISKLSNWNSPQEVLGHLLPYLNKNYFPLGDYFALLESSKYHPEFGRYSFLGVFPTLIVKEDKKEIILYTQDYHERRFGLERLWEILRNLLKSVKLKDNRGIPFMVGGIIGYFAYDFLEETEKGVVLKGINELPNLPRFLFCFYEVILCFDHSEKVIYLCRIDDGDKSLSNRISSKDKYDFVLDKLRCFGDWSSYSLPELKENLEYMEVNFTKDDYIRTIKKAKEYISAGEIYQVNLAQRFLAHFHKEPHFLSIYSNLSRNNPTFFSALLSTPNFHIISSSPERFLLVKDNMVQTRPIKGTRPRGRTKKEDDKFKNELLNSQKEKAELLMIVDLLRNDLGKVCKYNSIKVKELRRLEAWASVFHTLATIEGELERGKDALDLILAAFPGGSVTGCPKRRAIQIIDELEGLKRGIYCGSLGYLSFDGKMDMNLLIRTILLVENKAYFHVGGGIVADSIPEDEYKETLYKGKKIFSTLLSEKEMICDVRRR